MAKTSDILFSRNIGLLFPAQQRILGEKSIAIAGVGGDGGLLSERLARFGIGKLTIADPDNFEENNINRQFAANVETINSNKAEIIAKELRLINPELEVTIYPEGITADNVYEFVHDADVVVDEIEYSLPHISVMLHQEARKQQKNVFMGANLGWGASAFCFTPDGITFEEHFEYNEVYKSINPLRYFKNFPSSIDPQLVEHVIEHHLPVPAMASSVALVSAILSNEIILYLTGKRNPVIMPEFISIDLFDLTISV